MKVTATYQTSSYWILPEGVELDGSKEFGKPGSYAIKWDTLYYFDKYGKKRELKAVSSASESHDFKRPDETEVCELEGWEDEPEDDPDYWCDDDLMIQLNYGYCLVDGIHPKTSDEDWKLFLESCNKEGYSEERYAEVHKRLMERDGKIYGEDYVYLHNEETLQKVKINNKPYFMTSDGGLFEYIDGKTAGVWVGKFIVETQSIDKTAEEPKWDEEDSKKEDDKKGTESEHYCDVHEDTHLTNDGNGGWTCGDCEEDDWIDIYAVCSIQDFTACKTVAHFKKPNMFYQTMGGGPVGGWLVDEDGQVWDVNQASWGADWTYELTDYTGIIIREKDEMKGIPHSIKLTK